jgi:hypothetical protein
MLEKKIENFVKSAIILRNLRAAIPFLLHHANVAKKEDDAAKLSRCEEALLMADKSLIILLKKSLPPCQLDQNKNKEYFAAIRENISRAKKAFEEIPVANIPSPQEFLELLETCATSFAESELSSLLLKVREDEIKFDRQIILLEDLCALEE